MKIIRKAMIPLYKNHHGGRRERHANEVRESWTWSVEQAKRTQQESLAETLHYALKHIRFYRD